MAFFHTCLYLNIKQNRSPEKGSCAGGLCYNGGFCDGHKSTKNCLCPLGFSGENCTIGDYIIDLFTFTKDKPCAIFIQIIYNA